MFTGIIQTMGKVVSISGRGGVTPPLLKISFPFPLKDIKIGESIAVDGCCLTVVRKGAIHRAQTLTFDVSGETLQKTTIGSYRRGQIVNLERAMRPSDRFGGHFVTGHVDGVGEIRKIEERAGGSAGGGPPPEHNEVSAAGGGSRNRTRSRILLLEISFPKELMKYLIDKGSVTVDGISLTICRPTKNRFTAYIVPHTAKVTNLSQKRKGDPVNLEMDILGKYVQALINKT